MKEVCVYHGIDLDGYCSAAIWYHFHHEFSDDYLKFIPMNYGDKVPWEELEGNNVTLLDFTFEPWNEMEHLLAVANHVTWIDHHKTAIEMWHENGGDNIEGVRVIGKAACELAWEYYFPGQNIPHGVFLLGDYDVWRHSDKDTMMYQMGARLHDLDIGRNRECYEKWIYIFRNEPSLFCQILNEGETVTAYQKQENIKVARSWFTVYFADHKWMAINRGYVNSSLWESVWDDTYDGMLAFMRRRNCWTVTMYSKTIDCGSIAKAHGGGGHKGAAGFECIGLPFHLPGYEEISKLQIEVKELKEQIAAYQIDQPPIGGFHDD